jgi:transposase-like protein
MRKPSPPAKPQPEPEKFERWTAQRKAAIILEVLKGQISVPGRCRKHSITQGEFRAWADEYHRGGVDALKINKKALEAEHRAELKRLQSKLASS